MNEFVYSSVGVPERRGREDAELPGPNVPVGQCAEESVLQGLASNPAPTASQGCPAQVGINKVFFSYVLLIPHWFFFSHCLAQVGIKGFYSHSYAFLIPMQRIVEI